ncbi:phage tail protein [Chromobacterium piscinae]|uniref:phage tail protein n=1 Tax=Chromobacterium piscinae TaxID=686831 RepID=UPI001E2EF7EE|nr:phage tail protein [Chromobacterium piscinae]MCD5326764.1 phage tail protein [Chromobacterium piscinae]
MSVFLPSGSTLQIASAYGPAKAITALSNANPAVASAAAHGFAASDIIELTSGWARLNNRIARVGAAPVADSFKIDGMDTSDTKLFGAGLGMGSARAITGWTPMPQVLDFNTSGGEAKFATFQFLESDEEQQIPNGRSAMSIALKMADDPSLPCYPVLRAADASRKPTAIMLSLPNGGSVLYNCYVSFNETPELSQNSVMAVKVTLSLLGKATRY